MSYSRRLPVGKSSAWFLMDIQMPEMDGIEATGAIREKERGTRRHTPIVAMTAHALKGDQDRCLESGMDAYISKPIRSSNSAKSWNVCWMRAKQKAMRLSPLPGKPQR
jgi:CheY-like chemotaxis protein